MKNLLRLASISVLVAACGGRESSADSPADSMTPRRVAQAPAVLPQPPVQQPVADTPGAPVSPPAGSATPPAPATPEPGQAATAQPSDDAVELLRRVEQAASGIRTLEADFVQTMHVPLLNQRAQSSGRLFQKRPDRFLMRFTQPAGDVMVADGRHFWIYLPSSDRSQVIRTSIAAGGAVDLQRQFVGDATRRFVPTINGRETVDGHATTMLTLVPRGASPYRILKLWVDSENQLVRRFEITEENESVRRVELRGIRVNAAISDDVFSFTPPAGTQVFDQ
jgi:outer membrane lipoprotein carrier protein